jgi:hypothetical protein
VRTDYRSWRQGFDARRRDPAVDTPGPPHLIETTAALDGLSVALPVRMTVKWYALDVAPVIGTALAALALAAALCFPVHAQISMQRPGITGIPQGRKQAPPSQSPASLTADEQKRLTAIINRMKPKDRKKLVKALKKMTPQQRQQLLVALKQQLAQAKKNGR